MAFDAKQWFKELGLADDVATELAAKVGDEKVLTNLQGRVMAQSDYSRAMDKLRDDEKKLRADADAKLQRELAEIQRYRGESDDNFKRAQDERVKAEQALISVRSQIESLARDYALPNDAIEPILKGTPAARSDGQPPVTSPATRTNDPDPRYFTADAFSREANAFKRLPIEYQQISGEYEALFKSNGYLRPDDTTPSPMERILARAEADKVPLRAAFEREFNVSAKRKELQEADVQRRIKEAADERERTVRSQIAAENPNINTHRRADLPHSVALELAGPLKRQDAQGKEVTRPNPGMGSASSHEDRVQRAVAAFHENLDRSLEKVPA